LRNVEEWDFLGHRSVRVHILAPFRIRGTRSAYEEVME